MGEPATAVTADSVDRATAVLREYAAPTPLQRNDRLSESTGAEVWLKREDLQSVRSYKVRGALHAMTTLSAEQREHGVVCASAGNHAQGVAFACRLLGVRGRVYVPRTTPRQKRQRIAALGEDMVELVVDGDTYEDSAALAAQDAAASGRTLIPPFDDARVIAGQGSIAVEICEQLDRAPDAVVLPVGGGGLAAGMGSWLRTRHPLTRIVGVEPAGAASMSLALRKGAPADLAEVDTFVDGAAVRRVGDRTFVLVREAGVEMTVLDEGAVCTEMLDLYQSDGIIAEPAGALASGALGRVFTPDPGSLVVCVVSGGNNDISRYAEILERSLLHEGCKQYFLVEFAQEPGALSRFVVDLLTPDDDITLFEYVKRNNRETGPALVGLESTDRQCAAALRTRLEASAHPRCKRLEPGSALWRYLA